MSFVHLHAHSHFSLLDGLSKIDGLIGKAKENNMPALALTDHGVMYGLVDFYKKAKKAGVKPILGVEAYVAKDGHRNKRPGIDVRPNHLVLLATSEEGYRNLIKLTSIAHVDGFYYKPRVDHELLATYGKGLICLSACLQGEVANHFLSNGDERAEAAALRMIEIFGKDNFFLEVQQHPHIPEQGIVNEKVFALAKHLGLPVVATVDAHYLNADDNIAQDALVCIQTKKVMSESDRLSMIHEDFSFRTVEQLKEDWADHPEVLENTLSVAERCNFQLELGKTLLPKFEVPAGTTDFEYLKELCQKGLIKRYGTTEVSDVLKERMAYELGVIERTGFASYFLIVSDYINWAKDNKIVVGPGRGSAAGSLVAYLVGITNIDPLQYDLIFERFLNPERISMPDIDTDFADTRRDEVIEYISGKYGQDRVAQIITFGTMAARAAIRDVGRVLGLPYAYCDKVAKLIPMFTSLDAALKTIPELKVIMEEPDGKRLIEIARKLEGCARHASTHACGVVITPEPMDNYIPRQRSTQDENEITTQYEMRSIEDLGLLKVDLLGLKNLTIIENTLDILKKARGIEINIDNLPLKDKKTFDLFQRADTTGVFQLESSGMKRYLKMLRPSELEDIIAMVSLYRPGPMEFIPDFIAGKHGEKKITYLDPRLKEILEKTYGIIVYQEQVMEVARKLASFSYSEADVLRKAVGKKIAELLNEQEKKMIDGMVGNGIKPDVAKQIWEFILPFARYGFNRSHAACYAMIAYQTAYLKANYPAEFMASLLTADHGNTDRIAIEVEECRHMDLEVLPPDINESFSTFTVVYDSLEVRENKTSNKIRFGLAAIKNLGTNIIKEIIKERKENGHFANLEDLLTRVKNKDLNKKSLEALIKSGALDNLGERNQLLYNIEKILLFIKQSNEEAASHQSSLFGALATQGVLTKLSLEPAEKATDKQKLSWEKELLGLYVSAHPLQEFAGKLGESVKSIGEIVLHTNEFANQLLRVAGVVTTIKKIITKAGEPMVFCRIEDVTGGIEVLVFPKTYRENTEIWVEDRLVIMNCRLSDKDGETKLICNHVRELKSETIFDVTAALDQLAATAPAQGDRRMYYQKQYQKTTSSPSSGAPAPKTAGTVTITLPLTLPAETLSELKKIFVHHPGQFKTCLMAGGMNGKKIITPTLVDGSADFKLKIEQLLGQNTIMIKTR